MRALPRVLPLVLLLAAPAALGLPAAEVVRVLVGFHPEASLPQKGDPFEGGVVARIDETLRYAVVVTSDPFAVIARASLRPDVRYAELDAAVQGHSIPNDPFWSLQYGPSLIRAELAWELADATATIAIIDSGVKAAHADLSPQMWQGMNGEVGWDFVADDGDPADENGHGTHVAGTAAATRGNGIGVAGIADLRIMPVRVLGADNAGSASDVASGIVWAVDHGARVASLSLGTSANVTAIWDAVQYAIAHDVVVVASAGNDGCDCLNFPAAYGPVVAVGALDANATLWPKSNRGEWLDVTAPGVRIVSTSIAIRSDGSDGYAYRTGTSMAAPHVAAVLAQVRAIDPAMSAEAAVALLLSTTRDLGPPGHDAGYGHGMVDAFAVAAFAAGTPVDLDVTSLRHVCGVDTCVVSASVTNRGVAAAGPFHIVLDRKLADGNATILADAPIESLAEGASLSIEVVTTRPLLGRFTYAASVAGASGDMSAANDRRELQVTYLVQDPTPGQQLAASLVEASA